MKGWKWAGKLRVQICIIVVLVFIIWIVLQSSPAYRTRAEGER
jgi:hypothetical protein